MVINVEKGKVMRMSKQSCPAEIMIDHKQQENWNISTVWVT
jgi:hypothetical protein